MVQVEQKDVPIYGEWIGTLDGLTNADVRAQVTGYIMKQGYQEGAFVKQGQLLFEIDPRPFQAALDQAEGQLAQAKALLANAKAVQGRTQLDVERYAPLAKEQAASQQDLDNAVQNNLAAKATVQTAEAQIKSSEAAVETAKINLDFTRLIAPIDGIAGQAQLQVGALVNLSSGPVTSVSTVDPIKVYFTVGEPQYLAWRKRFPTESSRLEADKNLRLQLILADGSTYAQEGSFYFADRQVNVGTGAIRIAGLFPNPGNILRPGGYGKVRAVIPTRRLPSCGCRRRRQNQHSNGHGRRPIWDRMGYCRRAETRRESCRRRHSEGAPGRASENQALWRAGSKRQVTPCQNFSLIVPLSPW